MSDYGVENLHRLVGLEAVRAKPAMYVGTTANTDQLIYEEIDNSVDEFLCGHCTDITVTISTDATVTVQDNGRGIPVGISEEFKDEQGNYLNTLTAILTTLHAGGKFKNEGYVCSSGTYGVGVKATNALSDYFEVVVKRDGKIYKQTFAYGKPTSDVQEIGTCDINDTGTTMIHHPDKKIFKQGLFPTEAVNKRLKELAFLNSGLNIHYVNENTHLDITYYYESGIKGYVEQMIDGKNRLFDDAFYIKDEYIDENNDTVYVETSFIYDDELEPNTKLKSFANNINTREGGYHLQGLKNVIKDVFNKYGIDSGLLKEPIEMQYWIDGLYGVVSVKLREAQLDGQTKNKLGSIEAKDAVENVVTKYFADIVKNKKYKSILEAIVNRAIKTKEAELQARKARNIARTTKKVLKMSMPGKLADCSNKNGYRELFLVEGNSAAGSSKAARDSSYQAILALRGKLLNVNKAELDKILKSDTITNIIGAIGAGVGDTFDINNVRYDKIILMCDADVDGSHISSLVLTLFYYYMPELIKKGMVYRVMSPLYRIIKKDNSSIYLLDDSALNKYRKEHTTENYGVARMKGLGEMNPDQLSETSLSPATRNLKRIVINEAEQVAQAFEVLMGKNVAVRREFIENNSSRVDIGLM